MNPRHTARQIVLALIFALNLVISPMLSGNWNSISAYAEVLPSPRDPAPRQIAQDKEGQWPDIQQSPDNGANSTFKFHSPMTLTLGLRGTNSGTELPIETGEWGIIKLRSTKDFTYTNTTTTLNKDDRGWVITGQMPVRPVKIIQDNRRWIVNVQAGYAGCTIRVIEVDNEPEDKEHTLWTMGKLAEDGGEVLFASNGFPHVTDLGTSYAFTLPKIFPNGLSTGQLLVESQDDVVILAWPDCSNLDSDGDGIPNQQEGLIGSNPNNPDTDGDGLLDGVECPNQGQMPCKDSDGDSKPDILDPRDDTPTDFCKLSYTLSPASQSYARLATGEVSGASVNAVLAEAQLAPQSGVYNDDIVTLVVSYLNEACQTPPTINNTVGLNVEQPCTEAPQQVWTCKFRVFGGTDSGQTVLVWSQAEERYQTQQGPAGLLHYHRWQYLGTRPVDPTACVATVTTSPRLVEGTVVLKWTPYLASVNAGVGCSWIFIRYSGFDLDEAPEDVSCLMVEDDVSVWCYPAPDTGANFKMDLFVQPSNAYPLFIQMTLGGDPAQVLDETPHAIVGWFGVWMPTILK